MAYGSFQIGGYTHPTLQPVAAGLYKIAVDANGHITEATAATQEDFSALGVPETGSFTATLAAAGWTGTEAPYSQTVTVTGLPAGANGSVGVATTATDAQFTAAADAMLRVTAQAAGQITVKAYGTKPAVDIPIVINAVW